MLALDGLRTRETECGGGKGGVMVIVGRLLRVALSRGELTREGGVGTWTGRRRRSELLLVGGCDEDGAVEAIVDGEEEEGEGWMPGLAGWLRGGRKSWFGAGAGQVELRGGRSLSPNKSKVWRANTDTDRQRTLKNFTLLRSSIQRLFLLLAALHRPGRLQRCSQRRLSQPAQTLVINPNGRILCDTGHGNTLPSQHASLELHHGQQVLESVTQILRLSARSL